MEVVGSLEHLKKEISDSYASKLKSFKDEQNQRFSEQKKELMEQHEQDLIKARTELESEEKKVFQLTYAEEQLKARKKFEQKREEMITNVFTQATEKVQDILFSDDYLNLIKSFIKGKEQIIITGNSRYANKFEYIQPDDSINGIIVRHGKKIYDFTFEKFVESNHSNLRHMISQILFEDVS